MNLTFTKIIKAGNRLREFNFTPMFNDSCLKYSVDVTNEKSDRIYFQMNRTENEQWEITYNVLPPDWVMDEKYKLEEAINEEIKKSVSGTKSI
jgi:hypothetical protein